MPKKLRNKFLKLYHAKLESRHFNEQKIKERLATRYYFLKFKKEVTDFIIKYDLYRRIKYERYRPYKEL